MADTVKIKVAKGSRFGDKKGYVVVNGLKLDFAIDQEVEVPQVVADILRDGGISYEVVGADGVSASTAPLQDTVTRDVPNIDPLTANSQEREIPQLANGDEDTGVGVGGGSTATLGRDQQEGQLNAEGQGIAALVGAAPTEMKVKEPQTDTASREDTATKPEQSEQSSPVDGTIADVTEHLETVTDKAELQKLLDAEKAGKNRTGAISAIQAKIDAA